MEISTQTVHTLEPELTVHTLEPELTVHTLEPELTVHTLEPELTAGYLWKQDLILLGDTNCLGHPRNIEKMQQKYSFFPTADQNGFIWPTRLHYNDTVFDFMESVTKNIFFINCQWQEIFCYFDVNLY